MCVKRLFAAVPTTLLILGPSVANAGRGSDTRANA